MATIEELTETIVKFRDERDWAQFHNAKDLHWHYPLKQQN